MTTLQRQNLDSAIRLAAAQVGVTASETSGLPYALREPYANALSAIILRTPDRFDAGTVASARAEAKQVDQPLDGPTSVFEQVGGFSEEIFNQAVAVGESVASVGEGVKTSFTLSKWLIPAAVVIGTVLLLMSFSRRIGATK